MTRYSMTGYGEKSREQGEWIFTVTIQTLNSKNFDVIINGPQVLTRQMSAWRKRIAQKLVRGRVDINIVCNMNHMPFPLAIDRKTIKRCYDYLYALSQELNAETDVLGLTMRLLSQNPQEIVMDEKHWLLLDEVFEEALDECIKTRAKEGRHLLGQIEDCLAGIRDGVADIMAHIPMRKQHLRKRLEEKIKTREGMVDTERWEQEVLYYVEKMDIEEECVRLRSHMAYVHTMLEQEEAIGRRLGFIVQEMLREITTISAKAQDVKIQHLTVSIKEGIEQIREQGRNLL